MDLSEKIAAAADPLQRLIVLLADARGGEPIGGRIKLQKMVFVLSEASDDVIDRCGYGADDYGPYSEIVGEAARSLEEIGVLRSDRGGGGGGISITPMGRSVARRIAGEEEDGGVLGAVDDCKDMLNDLPVDEVLAYAYAAYPRMARRSAAYDRIMPDAERHILSMLKKEKITSERAAELLGRPMEYVWGKASEMGIQVLR